MFIIVNIFQAYKDEETNVPQSRRVYLQAKNIIGFRGYLRYACSEEGRKANSGKPSHMWVYDSITPITTIWVNTMGEENSTLTFDVIESPENILTQLGEVVEEEKA